jgi:endogenous inhibitor of DNA gyrase (YacG/DUF329 family)
MSGVAAPRRNPAEQRTSGAQSGQIDALPDRTVCVYCRRQPVDPRWRPFCSDRCRLQDLARWIDGDYRIAGEPVSLEQSAIDDVDDGP